ncbi:MAG: hypothetical protein VYA27_04660, partial [Verrucomicrobiota bacterium]|nr:hypothetical protein [Verrucomicrobiota bacterium]
MRRVRNHNDSCRRRFPGRDQKQALAKQVAFHWPTHRTDGVSRTRSHHRLLAKPDDFFGGITSEPRRRNSEERREAGTHGRHRLEVSFMGRSVMGPFRRPLFDNSRDLL